MRARIREAELDIRLYQLTNAHHSAATTTMTMTPVETRNLPTSFKDKRASVTAQEYYTRNEASTSWRSHVISSIPITLFTYAEFRICMRYSIPMQHRPKLMYVYISICCLTCSVDSYIHTCFTYLPLYAFSLSLAHHLYPIPGLPPLKTSL